ncbi:transmembrane protein 134-like isoform X1 [Homarus americanus]|uniref:Transmembrane protein 134-like n=1 Tax=Homarus americanus TaxID=6706 RepID=A0A8J5TL57_HOMAM|nr:transmembrane protein 134-like isoform X1 [Homarus americanus]KAG7177421.1 Transmembrane protein 134-like [Homarus americanus]
MLSMASKQSRNQPKFTIEDAFEEDADDAIRIYGATNERSPLKPKARDVSIGNEDVTVRVEDPLAGVGAASGVKGLLTIPDVDAISRDSDSLIPGDSSSSFSESPRWWFLHPKVREKWRIVAGAFTLLIMGIILLITGIVVEAVPLESLSGPVFIIAGLICFIPGAYHVVYVLLAVWGRRGYDFYNLPLFN